MIKLCTATAVLQGVLTSILKRMAMPKKIILTLNI